MKKQTKIICTLGPACETKEVIRKMAEAGMNVARLNFSHGSYDNHAMLIRTVREVEKELGRPLSILQDLQGPKIRVGVLPTDGVILDVDKEVVFDTGINEYTEGRIPIDYHELHQFLKPGERMLLNDGRSEVLIRQVEGTIITTTVVTPGVITSHKGLNVPDSHLSVRAFTDKDEKDVCFGVEQGVDFVALSFVTKPEDVTELKGIIADKQKTLGTSAQSIPIIAKIERREAIDRIEEILDVVDGIMVARGDLGIEMPAEQVPVLQKDLIRAARAHNKPVIVATQMLDSMQTNPRPTRAEVSDVANAVIDRADAVMLSNETATGRYPVQVVETMASIVVETELSAYDDVSLFEIQSEEGAHPEQRSKYALIESVKALVDKNSATLIVSFLDYPATRLLSHARVGAPILAVVHNLADFHSLNLSWGIQPVLLQATDVEEVFSSLKSQTLLTVGDRVGVVQDQSIFIRIIE